MEVNKLFSWYLSRGAFPFWCVLLCDCTIIVAAGYLSVYLTDGALVLATEFWQFLYFLLLVLPLFIIGMRRYHTYAGVIRYSSFTDLLRITCALLIGSLSAYVVSIAFSLFGTQYVGVIHPLSFTQLCILFFAAMVAQWSVRILFKYSYDTAYRNNDLPQVFIYGIKEGGMSIANSIRNETPLRFFVRGFVSDDPNMAGLFVSGTQVYAADEKLLEAMEECEASILFVSPLCTDSFRENEKLVNALTKNGIKIMMMPEAEDWDGKSELSHEQLHEVDIEDLLPRDKIDIDKEQVGAMLRGKSIMITGAAGSIGFEMVRQIADFHPSQLILIDQAETPMHDVRRYMSRKYTFIPCQTIVGSIANAHHMERLFATYRPEYVFHAAAYKHVPMMEDNPSMAIQNNVYGTRVIADLAVKYGTKKFVMVSTDKAVNPTNVMGCSKRICEIYCQALNNAEHNHTCQFITTRFGNVLGSNGSVIPIFKEQIRRGGPVTVTHPDIIRFFMLIPEACHLVLEAGTMGNGGEIFVFDMGKPVRIADLAQKMIDLSGAKNVKIKYTGLRDGEKLYEEVLNDAELTKPTVHPKIKVAAVREYSFDQVLKDEEELYELSFSFDDMAIVRKMKEIVPEYRSQHSKYEVLDK